MSPYQAPTLLINFKKNVSEASDEIKVTLCKGKNTYKI